MANQRFVMRPLVLILPLLLLASCATPPSKINNICAVFDQRDGFMNNWYRSSLKAERKYGVPRSVLLATIRMESGFDGKARPPRKKVFFGLFPGKHISTAYGYSQALDGTWQRYKMQTGNWGARRSNFDDAIDFVGWHHKLSNEVNGVALDDTYSLYLNYYLGHSGYRQGRYKNDAKLRNYARKAEKMADDYKRQMAACGR
tara:strand:- start:1094 stop:1696 length:603 start_codon:yes stop_codon:yes gene_type:complete